MWQSFRLDAPSFRVSGQGRGVGDNGHSSCSLMEGEELSIYGIYELSV